MKIEIEMGRNKKWFWRLVATNGKTLSHSENYSSKAKALQTVHEMEKHFKNGSLEVFVSGEIIPNVVA